MELGASMPSGTTSHKYKLPLPNFLTLVDKLLVSIFLLVQTVLSLKFLKFVFTWNSSKWNRATVCAQYGSGTKLSEGVGVGVGVNVGVIVGVMVGVIVGVADRVGVMVGVTVTVGVTVVVGVGVTLNVGVIVGVTVGVNVGVTGGVPVGVIVGVGVGVADLDGSGV